MKCDVCGKSKWERVRDEIDSSGQHWRLDRCANCHHMNYYPIEAKSAKNPKLAGF